VLDGGQEEIWGSNPQPNRQTLSPMLPPGEYKRGVGWTRLATPIPPFAKLLWSLFRFVLESKELNAARERVQKQASDAAAAAAAAAVAV